MNAVAQVHERAHYSVPLAPTWRTVRGGTLVAAAALFAGCGEAREAAVTEEAGLAGHAEPPEVIAGVAPGTGDTLWFPGRSGLPVVMMYASTDCAACKMSMPAWGQLADRFVGRAEFVAGYSAADRGVASLEPDSGSRAIILDVPTVNRMSSSLQIQGTPSLIVLLPGTNARLLSTGIIGTREGRELGRLLDSVRTASMEKI